MVFISYSSLDYVMANHIREILQKNDISCWMAPESIPGGSDYANEIPAAIESCDYFLLVLSGNSQDSIWVPKELDLAIDAKKMVLPIHIDLSPLKPHFRLRLSNVQCMDAAMNVEDVLDRVVQRITDHAIECKKHTGFSDSDDNGKEDPYLMQLNQARISYNQKAGSQYSYVKTLLFNKQPIQLSRIYTRMHLRDVNNKWIKTNDVNKLSKQYGHRLLITGGAGSGKSLMLRYMFLRVLKNHDQIPVLLFLRNLDYTALWANESEFLCEQILKNMQALGFDVSGEIFKRSLSELSYVVFLDGFDEVEYDVRKRLEYLINDFCKRFSNITVVVSSRPESSFVSWNHFVELEIQPLTRSLIKIMIERNGMDLSESEKLQEEIERWFQRKLPYVDFLRTPLLLNIVCMSFNQFGELPDKISLFYDQAFNALYNGQDKTKSGYVRSLESGLTYSDFKKLTEYICFKSYFKYEYSFPERTLLEYIQLAINKGIIPESTKEKEEILSDMVDRIGIFVRDGVYYVLVHRSFQEFFAAVYLENNMNDETQVQFFSSWLRKKRITATNLFLDILYDYNQERFIQNILVTGMDELEKKYEEAGKSNEYLIELLVESIYIRNHKTLNLRYAVAVMNDMYFNHIIMRICRVGIPGHIFSGRSARVLGLDDEKLKELSEKQTEFVSKMVDLYGFNKRVSIKELKEKGFYKEFIDSCYWIIERYEFAVRFIKDFKEKREMKSDTYQAILDSF